MLQQLFGRAPVLRGKARMRICQRLRLPNRAQASLPCPPAHAHMRDALSYACKLQRNGSQRRIADGSVVA